VFGIDQPALEAMARSEALQNLKSLPPGMLDRVAKQIRDTLKNAFSSVLRRSGFSCRGIPVDWA